MNKKQLIQKLFEYRNFIGYRPIEGVISISDVINNTSFLKDRLALRLTAKEVEPGKVQYVVPELNLESSIKFGTVFIPVSKIKTDFLRRLIGYIPVIFEVYDGYVIAPNMECWNKSKGCFYKKYTGFTDIIEVYRKDNPFGGVHHCESIEHAKQWIVNVGFRI